MDMTTLGLLFCKLLMLAGLGSLAPGTCFGGDTSALGLDATLLLLVGIVLAFPLTSRLADRSSVVLIIAAASVLAAGSAAIVHYFDY
jgi:hypothetical protein